jgi:O-antigen/teichoic acid export membrane protein
MNVLRNKIYNLIRKTERYFKTDMVYLVRGGFWLTLGQVITTLSGFLLSIAFANLLPRETYGVYRYVLSIASIVTAFSLTGLSTAIVQSVARGFEGSLRSSFYLSLRWSIPVTVISFVGSGYYFFKDNNILGAGLLLVGLFSPLLNSAGLFASFINGKKDFQRLSLYSMIDNLIPAAVLFLTLFLTDSVLIIVGVYFLSHTTMALILYWWTLRTFRPQPIEDKEIKDYSIKLSFLNIIGVVTTHIDKVLVFTFLGATELAIYGFATIFPEQIRSVLKNLNSLMIPKFSEKNPGAPLGLKRKTLQLGIVLVVITIVYILLAPLLYTLLFPQYIESVFY